MLIEHACDRSSEISLVRYDGLVNPEHTDQITYIPIVKKKQENHELLQKHFLDELRQKSSECRKLEKIDALPIEIHCGTTYIYQTSRQRALCRSDLENRCVNALSLRNEQRRAHDEKQFLITFNKNKSINDPIRFDYEVTCAGFRQTNEQLTNYRLYLRHRTRRIILELKQTLDEPRCFAVKRILKYSSKFAHVDLVKWKNSASSSDELFDVRTTIGKAFEEEQLEIDDDYCDFIRAKSLERCVFQVETHLDESSFQINRDLLPFFDYFQVKKTQNYDYSCIDVQFFGVRLGLEHQIGYDSLFNGKTRKACLKTENVLVAKLLSTESTDEEAKRIFTLALWLSDLATRCVNKTLPKTRIYSRKNFYESKVR